MFAGLALPFGGAHLYAQRYVSAANLAGLVALTCVLAAWGNALAFWLWPVIVGLDIAGATYHCERANRDGAEPRTNRWRRFAVELAIAVVLATALGAWLVGSRARVERHAPEVDLRFEDWCAILEECDEVELPRCLRHVRSWLGDDLTLGPDCRLRIERIDECSDLPWCEEICDQEAAEGPR